jgi:hypothetical protein
MPLAGASSARLSAQLHAIADYAGTLPESTARALLRLGMVEAIGGELRRVAMVGAAVQSGMVTFDVAKLLKWAIRRARQARR